MYINLDKANKIILHYFDDKYKNNPLGAASSKNSLKTVLSVFFCSDSI